MRSFLQAGCQVRPWILLCLVLNTSFLMAQQPAKQKLDDYLSKHASRLQLQKTDYGELYVTSGYVDAGTGIEHIYAQQRINGIDVVGGLFSLHASTRNGKAYEADNLVKTASLSVASSSPSVAAEQAARTVLKEAHHPENTLLLVKENAGNKIVFGRNDNPALNIPVRKVYLPNTKEKKLALAWEVQMFDAKERHYWIMYVDAASGKLLKKRDAIIHCNFASPAHRTDNRGENPEGNYFHIPRDKQLLKDNTSRAFLGPNNKYKVFPEPFEAPNAPGAAHVLTTNPGDATASVDGWHKVGVAAPFNYSRGNNVWSFYDPSPGPLGGVPNTATVAYANNGLGGTPPLVEPFEFNYPFDPATDPANSQKAAIVNLFYWNNLIHDVLYHFGFDENLNFQDSHLFSTGLKGPADGNGQGDAVLAQAQDGGGTNNANFLTLPDGVPASGQMQMYLWTTSTADQLVQIKSSTTGTPAAGTKYIAVQGSLGNALTANNDLYNQPVIDKQFVIVQKNPLSTVGDDSQGCSTGQQSIALPPGNNVTDKIVLIDRGNCSFVEKVLGAQLGGAVGVIVINNVDGDPIAMGGSDAPTNAIRIPSVMVSKADGEALKAVLRSGATIVGSLKKDSPNEPRRDGDFDNGVIAHEYGHGVSNRLTGGGDVLLPLGGDEQGGEGWSDFIALYMTQRSTDLLSAPGYPNGKLPSKGIGTYVSYESTNGAGIRPSKYDPDKSKSPYSFKDIGKGGEISIPHGVGHIWCQMLYSLEQEMIDIYGFNNDVYNSAVPTPAGNVPSGAGGNNVAMRLVMDGMKLQPSSPSFEEQRDAILKADTLLYNAQHSCRIWKAFAKWGLGFSARSGTNGVGDEVEAYDVPPACDPTQVRVTVSMAAPDTVINGLNITYTLKATNPYANPVSFALVADTLSPFASFQTSVPSAAVAGRAVNFPVTNLAAGETKTFTITAKVQTPTAGSGLFFDNHEDGEGGWTKTSTISDNWQLVSNRTRSGSKAWFAPNVDGFSNMSLSSTTPVAIPAGGAELVFWHYYATESDFDGGLVEISNDGGATWNYLPPQKFVRNGYNGLIPTANLNPFTGPGDRFAFTGTSSGYQMSIASLSDYVGQNILVRFRLSSDVGTAVDGWYIDDVFIMTGRTEITNKALAKVSNSAGFVAPVFLDSASAMTFVVGSSLTPLPAVLTDLKAAPQGAAIRLDWATLQEQDIREFVLERQAQNEHTFSAIGNVQSAGNSNSRRSYQYADQTAQRNILYSYRVKMTGLDGSTRYTNIATAKIGDGKFGFSVVPNPASSNVKLAFENQPSNNAMLRVYDVAGKLLSTFNVGNLNSASTTINVSSFNNGVYWMELEDNGRKQTQKLIIQR